MIILATITSLLLASVAVRIVLLWPLPLSRAVWSLTAAAGALTFARQALEAHGFADPWPARASLLVLVPLSVYLIDRIRRHVVAVPLRRRLALAEVALLAPLAAWPLSLVALPLAAVATYPPLWILCIAIWRRPIGPPERVKLRASL